MIEQVRGWNNHVTCVGHEYDILRVLVAVDHHQANQD